MTYEEFRTQQLICAEECVKESVRVYKQFRALSFIGFGGCYFLCLISMLANNLWTPVVSIPMAIWNLYTALGVVRCGEKHRQAYLVIRQMRLDAIKELAP